MKVQPCVVWDEQRCVRTLCNGTSFFPIDSRDVKRELHILGSR